MFRNHNSSLLTQHTVNQYFFVLLNEKSVHQAQLPLLCMDVPMGYMFRPYMRVIIRPLHT